MEMDSLQFGWQDLHFLTILDEETRHSFFRDLSYLFIVEMAGLFIFIK